MMEWEKNQIQSPKHSRNPVTRSTGRSPPVRDCTAHWELGSCLFSITEQDGRSPRPPASRLQGPPTTTVSILFTSQHHLLLICTGPHLSLQPHLSATSSPPIYMLYFSPAGLSPTAHKHAAVIILCQKAPGGLPNILLTYVLRRRTLFAKGSLT